MITMHPDKETSYRALCQAICNHLVGMQMGEWGPPERVDLEIGGLLHQVLEKVPLENIGPGEP